MRLDAPARSGVASCCSPRVPNWDPETEEAALTLELAIALLEDAAGGQVEGRIGDTDALVAVHETLEREPFDEVIVSTLPARVSQWLRRDLPARAAPAAPGAAREVSGQHSKPTAASRCGNARVKTGVSPRSSNGPTGLDWRKA